jgi:hypothetical protein
MKAKRKPGAGRKPRGPFSQNSAMMTVRMPSDLRDELERSANRRGWSLSQELLWRVRSSYKRQREEERRPPATRALCFLISELAERVGFFDVPNWHRSPFAFRAFHLAVARLLEAIEPVGSMDTNPYEIYGNLHPGSWPTRDAARAKAPETVADFMANGLIHEMLHPRPRMEARYKELLNDSDPERRSLAEYMLDTIYGMGDARRDLALGEPKEDPHEGPHPRAR